MWAVTLWLCVANVDSPSWDQGPRLLCYIGLWGTCPRKLCPLLGLQAGCGPGAWQVSASHIQAAEEEETWVRTWTSGLLWAVSLGALLLVEEGRQGVSCKHCRLVDYKLLTTIWRLLMMALFTLVRDEIGSVTSALCIFNSHPSRPVACSSTPLPHPAVPSESQCPVRKT